MIRKISSSIRTKGTLVAIGILCFSCFSAFSIMTVFYLIFIKNNNIDIRDAHIFMFITLCLCVVIGGTLLFIAMSRISEPIVRISHAAKEVAHGNFSIKVDNKSNDEIGTLAQNFNLMVAELNTMEYLRKDFMSNVSHEFKTPIASIQGFAEMLQHKNLSDHDFQQYTTIIIEESSRLSYLCSNMLRLSRLDNHFIPEVTKLFSLDEQIRKTIVLLEDKWTKKNLEFNIDLEDISFHGDEALLQQIWLNLIENAIKFSYESGLISIRAQRQAKSISVEIKDHGIGIAEKRRDRIYDKFYQSDTSHSKEGNGLGLAIVKKIADICEGTIELKSEIGVGTTVIITLPTKDN
jgi:signal transduction histidine kinase